MQEQIQMTIEMPFWVAAVVVLAFLSYLVMIVAIIMRQNELTKYVGKLHEMVTLLKNQIDG